MAHVELVKQSSLMSNPQPNPEMRGTFKACYRGTIELYAV